MAVKFELPPDWDAPQGVLSPEVMYIEALSALYSGLLWELLEDRRRVRADVTTLLRLRGIRTYAGGGEGFLPALLLNAPLADVPRPSVLMPVDSQSEDEAERSRNLLTELARRKLVTQKSLIERFVRLAYCDIAVREGLLCHPLGMAEDSPLGLPVLLFDEALANMGWDVGGRHRCRILKKLSDEGLLVLKRGDRWYQASQQATAVCAEDAPFYRRFRFLSMLDQTVTQRFVGGPGFLWFAGFIENEAGRKRIQATLATAAEDWLEAHRVSLWSVQPGQEHDLVWVQAGLVTGACRTPHVRMPEYLEHELLWTVGGGLSVRLGPGVRVEQHLLRALLDRSIAEGRALGIEDAVMERWLHKRLGITLRAVREWSQGPTFEHRDVRGQYQAPLLHEAVKRISALLHERHPKAMTLMDVMDHARIHWPLRMQNPPLLERALMRMVDLHQVATLSLEHPIERSYLRGYRAITTLVNSGPCPVPERLIAGLRQLRTVLNTVGTEEPPHFFAQQVILHRDAVPAFHQFCRALVISCGIQWDEALHPRSGSGGSDLGNDSSLLVFQLSTQQLGLKRPNARYT